MSHSVMALLSNTSWVTYVTGYYERWNCGSCPQARYKVCIALFPSWDKGTISYSLQEAKSHYHSRCVFLYSGREEVSLNSDSGFRAKAVEDQRHSAFLKDTLIHHVVIVLFFFSLELVPEVTFVSRKDSVGG